MPIKDYSSTAASNAAISGISIVGTAAVNNFDNAMREQLADIANWTDSDTIASATTTDIGSVEGMYVTITGTTTITGLGTLKAGMVKFLRFSGALTLTHNATSLIIPGGANFITAAGDTAVAVSEGSGNWRVLMTARASENWVDVASATTTDIGAVASPNVRITGTTTITGLGTIAAGATRRVRFAGALTLTHNGTSLILPGAANITTAAGDVAEFISEGSGNWRCTHYLVASYAPPIITPWVAYTPTYTGFGTVSNSSMFSRRVGSNLEVRGKFTAGTTTAVGAEFTLGFNGTNGGLTTNLDVMPTGRSFCGSWASSLAAARAQYMIANGSASVVAFSEQTASRASLTQLLGTQAANSGDEISVLLSVPITGW